MLGDLQELNTREEVSKSYWIVTTFSLVSFDYFANLYFLSTSTDKVTKGVQLARKEAEDLCPTRRCV